MAYGLQLDDKLMSTFLTWRIDHRAPHSTYEQTARISRIHKGDGY